MCDKILSEPPNDIYATGTENKIVGRQRNILSRIDQRVRELENQLIELKAARNILESHQEAIEAVQTALRYL